MLLGNLVVTGLCLIAWAALYSCLREGVAGWVSGFPPRLKDMGQKEMASSCGKGGLDWISGKISSLRELPPLEQAAWGSGWVTIPELCKKRFRGGLDSVREMVGPDDPEGLSQLKWFCRLMTHCSSVRCFLSAQYVAFHTVSCFHSYLNEVLVGRLLKENPPI